MASDKQMKPFAYWFFELQNKMLVADDFYLVGHLVRAPVFNRVWGSIGDSGLLKNDLDQRVKK